MLVSEVTRVRSRQRTLGALALAFGLGAVVALGLTWRRDAATPSGVAVVAVAPAKVAAAPVAPAPLIDEPLVKIAAASDAPVIAVASKHRIWISRDGGKTFASALQGSGLELDSELFVEPAGRVYSLRSRRREFRAADGVLHVRFEGELGIAEVDGRERWRELTDGMVPWAAGEGVIAGVGSGGIEIGHDAGGSWSSVPGTQEWNPWVISVGEPGVVRFLASHTAKDDGLDLGMSLVVARDGRPGTAVWSMRVVADPGVPSDETPCAGFGGSTLHLVVTDRKAGPGGTRLIRVGGDGAVRSRVLARLVGGVVLDPGVRCEIAGNEHAAYLAIDDVVFRIDGREPEVLDHTTHEVRSMAVDGHGDLLVLGHRCVRRLQAGARREDELVCGPAID